MSSQPEPALPPDTWHAVLPSDELPAGAIRAVEVAGAPLVVVRQGDAYVAMDRWCPHEGGDLAEGRVLARTLKCPLHGYMFSLDHGRGLNCRGYNARLYETRVAEGMLQVRLRQ
jgi:3-phenylpropionate/trans-cinnamate dioxygenase ferredoxin subunit